MSQEERVFAEDMEIGSYAFKYKNYRGAELRFRHALEYKPGQPDATFKLAESRDKLGKNNEAKQEYQAYVRRAYANCAATPIEDVCWEELSCHPALQLAKIPITLIYPVFRRTNSASLCYRLVTTVPV